jgi:septal ring factor EnvC (AmiA/AmiB activator)
MGKENEQRPPQETPAAGSIPAEETEATIGRLTGEPPAEKETLQGEIVPALPGETTAPVENIPAPPWRLAGALKRGLRWAAVLVVVFALGLLAAVVWFYRPAAQARDTARADLQQVQQKLDEANQTLASTQKDLNAAKTDLSTARANLDKAAAHGHLMGALYQATLGRRAVERKDGPAAQQALKMAQQELEQALPTLRQVDASYTERVQARLKLASDELLSDPAAAASDLEILDKWALELDQLLQK